MPSYSLSILRHDDTSDLLTFDKPKVLIGREAGDIVTRDPKMSGRHAELTFEGGVLRFTDLNSTNGSYRVSGERIVGSIVLTPGTALRLGECTIAIQEIESGAALGPGGTQVMEVPAALADTAFAPAPSAALAQAAAAAPAPAAIPAAGSGQQALGAPPFGQPAGGAFGQPAGGGFGQPPGASFGQPAGASFGQPGGGVPFGQQQAGSAQPGGAPQQIAVPPAAAYGAPPPAGTAGDGLFDLFKSLLARGASIYKAHGVNGALTLGVVMVPAALIGVATGWIPVLGWIVGILVALFELAVAPISAGAMWRWSFAAASGQSLTWKEAWGAALKNPVSEWLNVAVMGFVIMVGTMFLVVPGIILGLFAAPAYLLEGKAFFGANMRSLDLVMKNPGRHLGLALLVAATVLPVMLLAGIATMILGFIPLLGAPLAQLIMVTALVVVLPFVYLVWASIYFDARKRIEGEDAAALCAPTIRSWTRGG